jgi:6-aminohexanoate-oligomer endohydrolase
MLSNDLLPLHPRTVIGGRALTFEFPALHVGVAEYDEGPTGCTVFHFLNGPVPCVLDVRGGAPGVLGDYGAVDAIALVGGSCYGLEAVTGVSAALLARRGYAVAWGNVALVSGAVIYDFGARDNAIYPDKALGRAALEAARPGHFPLGRHGAGCSATVGKWSRAGRRETAGQGGAFRQAGPTKVAVFSVVNALGAIVDRQGRVVRGELDPATGARASAGARLEQLIAQGEALPAPPPGNTTLTVLVTNQKLSRYELTQLGRQVHASMARAIQPFHTHADGDVLFAVSTEEVENPTLPLTALGVLASELAWDAVLTCWQDG